MSGIILEGDVRIPYSAIVDTGNLEMLKQKYTVSSFFKGDFEMFSDDPESNYISFPRSVLSDIGASPVDNRSEGRALNKLCLFEPRDGQLDVVDRAVRSIEDNDSAMIVAGCGTGKTIMGTVVAMRTNRSTCILVHKEFLAAQWEEAIHMLCPDATIGRIQSDRCDSGDDFDFVIAVTQSVTNPRREYPESVYRSFGLIVADEVHRYGADVWHQAISRFPAKRRLALTATPHRMDGLWPVIEANFGPHQIELKAKTLVPTIQVVTTNYSFQLMKQKWLDDIHVRAKVVSKLCESEGRNEIVTRVAKKAFDANKKILVISERRAQLDWIKERLGAYFIDDVGMYVGGKKMGSLDEAAEKQIVLTTYQMAKEGLNIPALEVLIMASPQTQIQQTVGRVLREHKNKGKPVVIDFVDPAVEVLQKGVDGKIVSSQPLQKMYFARQRQYKKLGYDIAKRG